MDSLSHADAFEVLCLQAADNGRGDLLFGDCFARVREEGRAFCVGEQFPSVYLEFPLAGTPFLDVTMLYNRLPPHTRIASSAAAGAQDLLDWYARTCSDISDVCMGFELDTKNPALPAAAVHFQPRSHVELVRPFCDAAGEPERADLYLDLAARMPEGWPLSFFGMFRGRPCSPLRVCGYLRDEARAACAHDPARLAEAFDAIGFSAYDEAMLAQVAALMDTAPATVDFQFDVCPDASLGTTFAVDVQFGIEGSSAARASFASGAGARVMGLLEGWGAADDRWHTVADAAMTTGLPARDKDGVPQKYAFVLYPNWVKARWCDGVLQPAKLYHYAYAGFIAQEQSDALM